MLTYAHINLPYMFIIVQMEEMNVLLTHDILSIDVMTMDFPPIYKQNIHL